MGVVFGGFVPHPPIIVPAVGKNNLAKAKNTVEGMRAWAQECLANKPDTIVIISPHGPVFQDAIMITAFPRISGSLSSFGAPDVRIDRENDLSLVQAIADEARRRDISIGVLDKELAKEFDIPLTLDHGTMVPLYFLSEAGFQGKVLPIAMGLLPREQLYAFGMALRDAMAKVEQAVALVASGDLSHRLSPDAPAGYNPLGREFDAAVEQAFAQWDIEAMLNMDENLCETAGECGFRPLLMLAGAFDNAGVKSRVYSYEGPFGVGYMVASITGEGEKQPPSEDRLTKYRRQLQSQLEQVRQNESIYVRFARQTLEAYVREEELPPIPAELSASAPAGAFVSIKKKGQLRGCIGTIAPTQDNVGEEIRHNAISAGANDPRFFPVEAEELDDLVYSVDVLSPEEPIDSMDALDPQRYGVIVRFQGRQGLLLPMLDGVDTVEEQVDIARQKAGIAEGAPIKLSRFEVIRHH
ncbi:AmmeMemoRadiSam system protein A [Heliobacillus mobilis]|uniref:AmmeMemoRadiSam system protein A n=1 Tax=Heliobacterium mobile TaxID=28064 RepID=A0A6I3SKY2_HELMO|nr:AmmeMemoRadiSam system protein A [Heliobacterium mobile]MTV49415.1 AmmeMemoRadiSam system protein A [Heliobacterium mobile]